LGAVIWSRIKKLEEVATKENLGKEKVNGYACDKYRFTFNDKSMGTMTQWFSKKLNFPIKSVMMGSQGEISTEYKNIKRVIEGLLNDEEAQYRYRKNCREYFDRYATPQKVAAYVIDTLKNKVIAE